MRTLHSWSLVITLVFAACAGPRSAGPGVFGDGLVTANTTVVVTNNNSATVAIYALNRGIVHRLGLVLTGETMSFALPSSAVLDGDLELRALPVGSRVGYATGPIPFAPGETIEFTVENMLELSNLVVY